MTPRAADSSFVRHQTHPAGLDVLAELGLCSKGKQERKVQYVAIRVCRSGCLQRGYDSSWDTDFWTVAFPVLWEYIPDKKVSQVNHLCLGSS